MFGIIHCGNRFTHEGNINYTVICGHAARSSNRAVQLHVIAQLQKLLSFNSGQLFKHINGGGEGWNRGTLISNIIFFQWCDI